MELQRRIERGTMSVSLLARQTGLAQAHISNFLHGRRQLSLGSLDRILKAQHLSVWDLAPARRGAGRGDLLNSQQGEMLQIPLVNREVAAFDPFITASKVQSMLPWPATELSALRERCTSSRRQWERFVAIRADEGDVAAMAPLLRVDALLLLDRHYNSFIAYRPDAANLFAVRKGPHLAVRYADSAGDRIVLRAQDSRIAAEVLEAGPGEMLYDLLVGRVALMITSP